MRIDIKSPEAGARLDKVLVDRVRGLGRAGAKRLFDEGKVRLIAGGEGRGRRAAKGDVAQEGDAIDVDIRETLGEEATPEPDAPLSIVLEMKDIVVVDKPAGQPAAPLRPDERGTIANALAGRYPEMRNVGFSPREPGLVHRLDTGTTGLLLAARSEQAFSTMSQALKEGRLDKRYLLICAADGLPESGTIEIPLAPHPKDRRRVYACIHPRDVARYAPKPAVTAYTTLSVHGDLALVEVSAPKAARHQIRVHFAAIDHPLAGDQLYGGPEIAGLTRHALHAHLIVWKGDATVPAFTASSPLPPDLAALITDDKGTQPA